MSEGVRIVRAYAFSAAVLCVVAWVALGGYWNARAVRGLEVRVAALEAARAAAPAAAGSISVGSPTAAGGAASVVVNGEYERERAEIFSGAAPELTAEDLALAEGCSARWVTENIREVEGEGWFWFSADGRGWPARKDGRRWLVRNPWGDAEPFRYSPKPAEAPGS